MLLIKSVDSFAIQWSNYLSQMFQVSVMGKPKNKITNWNQYDKAFEQRITFWIDGSAINALRCTEYYEMGDHELQHTCSTTEIKLPWWLKWFCLSHRVFLVVWSIPFSRLWVRHVHHPITPLSVNVLGQLAWDVALYQKGLLDYSTDLKVSGEREWKVRKHGSDN